MKIFKANILHTPAPEKIEAIPHGFIAVDDNGSIEGIYPTLPSHLQGIAITDFGDRMLIPAMNDLHLHAPQYRNMGMALDLPLLQWLETYTFPEESKFSDLKYAEKIYKRFVHELWWNGTMRCAVYATIHRDTTLLLARLLQESGMGAYIGLVGMDRNCPEYLQNSTTEVIRDTTQLLQVLDGDPLVHPIVTPRFVPSCSGEMMDALGELAIRKNIPVQSHLSENVNEIAWVRELEPESTCYADAYYRHGLFGQTPTLMAHCCYSDGIELELMRKQQIYAVHCPSSNCNLPTGMAHVRKLLNNGIKVALGSDISGGHTMSIFSIIRYAIEVSKIIHAETSGQEPFLTLSEAFWIATKSGGSFFGKVGSFETGYTFDALVIDDQRLNSSEYTLAERLERYIYLGDPADIQHRFCQGKELSAPSIH